MRLFKPHTLSEAEEKIVNIKNVTGTEALNNLYDAITNRYTFKLEVEGVAKEITRGELMSYVRQGDPDLRARAFQELYHEYGESGRNPGHMYQPRVPDRLKKNTSLRKCTTPTCA